MVTTNIQKKSWAQHLYHTARVGNEEVQQNERVRSEVTLKTICWAFSCVNLYTLNMNKDKCICTA